MKYDGYKIIYQDKNFYNYTNFFNNNNECPSLNHTSFFIESFDYYLLFFIKDNVILSLFTTYNCNPYVKKDYPFFKIFLKKFCFKLTNVIFFFIKNQNLFLKYQKELSFFEKWEISIIKDIYLNYKIFYFNKDDINNKHFLSCIDIISYYFFNKKIVKVKESNSCLKQKSFIFTKYYKHYFDFLINKIKVINSYLSDCSFKINCELSVFLTFFLFISLSPTHNLSQVHNTFVIDDDKNYYLNNFYYDDKEDLFWVNSFCVINTFSDLIFKFDMLLTFILYFISDSRYFYKNFSLLKNSFFKQKDDFFLKKLIKHILFILTSDSYLEKKKKNLNDSISIKEITSILDKNNFFLNIKDIDIKDKYIKNKKKIKKKTLTFYSFFKKKNMFGLNFFNNLKLNKFFFFHDLKDIKINQHYDIISFYNSFFSFNINLFSYCINGSFHTIENFYRKNSVSNEHIRNMDKYLVNKMFNIGYKINFNFIQKEIEYLESGFNMSRFDLFLNKHLDFYFKNKFIMFKDKEIKDLNVLLFYSQFIQIFFFKDIYSGEIFISNFFDFRARRYYNSMVGFTSFKLFRYMYLFNEDCSKENLQFFLEKIKKLHTSNIYITLVKLDGIEFFLKKFEDYFDNFLVFKNILGLGYYSSFRILFTFVLVNLSKILKKKFSYAVGIFKFLEYGIEIIFNYFNKNGELNLIYKNEQFDDEHRWILQSTSLFIIDIINGDLNCFNYFSEKDSTASMSQLMSLILGLNDNNIIIDKKSISPYNIVNVGSVTCQTTWYDYYSFILILFKEKTADSFFKKFNEKETSIILQRSFFKKAIMTKSYGVTLFTMRKSLQEFYYKNKDLQEVLTKNNLKYLTEIFYKFLETDLEKICYKNNSKDLITFFEKKIEKKDYWQSTPDGVEFCFVYFKTIQKRFDIKKTIRISKSSRILLRKTHTTVKLCPNSVDFKLFKNSIRANLTHSIDAYTIRYVCRNLDNVITIHDCFLVSILDIPHLMDSYQKALLNVKIFFDKNCINEGNENIYILSNNNISSLFVLL